LRELLVAPTVQPPPIEAVPPSSSADILSLLSRLQNQQRTTTPAQGVVILSDLVAAQTGERSLGQVDRDVIQLVDLLFKFILEDHSLAAAMKDQLALLQIPILKVAIVDHSFFSKGGHPARRLLNEMASAAVGWQAAPKGRDALYLKINAIVQQLLEEFQTDTDVFAQLLADFLSFREKEQHRTAMLEQRTLDAESGKARAEESRTRVSAVLDKVRGERPLPEVVSSLLHETWANVLFLIRLKRGEDAAEWRQAVQTAEDLVWSVTAPMVGDNRQRLLELVPELLQRLRQGLDSIAYPPYDTIQLMKQLEPLHMARLKKASAESPPKATDPVPKPKTSELSRAPAPSTGATQTRSAAAITTAPPSPEPHAEEEWLQQVDKLTQGSWFEIEESPGQAYRCRLAAILKPAGRYIFVNRSGMKVADRNREGLAQALQQGTLRQLDDGMLFDRALVSVIGNLRKTRGGSAS